MPHADEPPHLGIHWMLDSGFGAGVLGINIVLELCRTRRLRPVLLHKPGRIVVDALTKHAMQWTVPYTQLERIKNQYHNPNLQVDFPVLYAGGNAFEHGIEVRTTAPAFSIIAFENTHFDAAALEKSKAFARIFTESSWNANVLRDYGCTNVVEWTQGVDTTLFHPAPRRDLYPDRFLIFSGGKLEYRKAQDLVIAAFRIFHRSHPDAVLVTAWTNPWKQLIRTMHRSPWVTPPTVAENQTLDVAGWLTKEGIEANQIINIGFVPNALMPNVMRACDVALFPNRAEGGTNLVAMECLACGLPTILSANTGHLDLIEQVPCYVLGDQEPVTPLSQTYHTDGWGESSVDEIVERLTEVYNNRQAAQQRGREAAKAMQAWSWHHKVDQMVTAIEEAL